MEQQATTDLLERVAEILEERMAVHRSCGESARMEPLGAGAVLGAIKTAVSEAKAKSQAGLGKPSN